MTSNKSLAHSKAVLNMLMEKYPHLFDFRRDYIFPSGLVLQVKLLKTYKFTQTITHHLKERFVITSLGIITFKTSPFLEKNTTYGKKKSKKPLL
ncbi:hypothetical protein [Acinetobacter sp. V117_2]|uniref:hypothetical protein n=1 Tax=Acinetobacter sp. V117_2 TaxID=3072989 RepID=UPI00287F7AE0|nr:hypothetical protein [Acinetobacter sp. V117_2]